MELNLRTAPVYGHTGMRAAGIKPEPLHDSLQRAHFLTFSVKDHLEMVRRKDSSGWYWSVRSLKELQPRSTPIQHVVHSYASTCLQGGGGEPIDGLRDAISASVDAHC